jgi:hypothetical protein
MKIFCKSLAALCLICSTASADCITPQQAKIRVLEKYSDAKFQTLSRSKLYLAYKLTGQSDFKVSDTLYLVTISSYPSSYILSGFKSGCYKTMGFVKKIDFPIQ